MNSSGTYFYTDHVICPECGLSIPLASLDSHYLYHSTLRLLNSQLFNDPFNWLTSDEDSYTRRHSTQPRPFANPFVQTRTRMAASRPLLEDFLFDDNEDNYEFNTMVADMLGNVEVGVTNINKVSTKIEHPSQMDCSICLETVKEPRKLICGHIYCDHCISTWLSKHQTCPSCRINLEDAYKENEKIDTASNE